jgi:2-polyprenyl-3-methyl-5-hydroxy-6-metoxy-1,4-benzoquinol methylase
MWHLDIEAEKRRYDLHRNSPEDAGYRRFLNQLVEPLVPMLQSGACGLDFGCGPGPVLARILEEQGFSMAMFDPFYASETHVLDRRYSFVVCTETVEHFRRPSDGFATLRRLVGPRGWLGIMTQRRDDVPDFLRWRYAADETHIAFYSHKTFEWLARRWEWDLSFHGQHVVIMRSTETEMVP